MIFQRYAELGSVALLKAELDRLGVVSKRREGAGGCSRGRQAVLARRALSACCRTGSIAARSSHQDAIYPGQHEAIVDAELWQIVQDKLAANRRERSLAAGAEEPSLLAGLIFDSDGDRLIADPCRQEGQAVSLLCLDGAHHRHDRSEHPKGRRIPAGDIEGLVLDRLRALFASGAEVSDAVAPLGLDASTQRAVLDRSAKLAERWTKLASLELRELVQSLVERIEVGDDQISVSAQSSRDLIERNARRGAQANRLPAGCRTCCPDRLPQAFAGPERACGW